MGIKQTILILLESKRVVEIYQGGWKMIRRRNIKGHPLCGQIWSDQSMVEFTLWVLCDTISYR